mgnify:CR=1 FL=1
MSMGDQLGKALRTELPCQTFTPLTLTRAIVRRLVFLRIARPALCLRHAFHQREVARA